MTTPLTIDYQDTDLTDIAKRSGRIVVFVTPDLKLDKSARRINRETKGAVERVIKSADFEVLEPGQALVITYPVGVQAEAVVVVKLPRRPDVQMARKAGVSLAKMRGDGDLTVLTGSIARADEIALGLMLRAYAFDDHRTKEVKVPGAVQFMVLNPDHVRQEVMAKEAVAKGVFFTRDLTNEPANVLTTTAFADRLVDMQALGLKVRVLEEPELEKLGMRTLLSVGQGSESPSKVVVMEWQGGDKKTPPFALVGKGVVFDTGGISLKPSAGMEEMTMDMGGAGVVAGVMRAVALRKAKANVVGLVGLVENMPDGRATRPGDVIRTMKGDTVEITNTDAEGRLVLADVLWYAQETFKPKGMVDLATLTGAIIIGLGHEKAGAFANDNPLARAFLRAAEAEGEGAWRMPLDPAYDKQLKSRVADMNNVGGRPAGSITAAQFLQRFVKEGTPWMHLDIAGVASRSTETTFAPKGATGWGVMALNRLIADHYED
jgi:leucyl aminopeptidase